MREYLPTNPRPSARITLLMKSPARRWAATLALLVDAGVVECMTHSRLELWGLAEETRNDVQDDEVNDSVELAPGPNWNFDHFTVAIAEQVIRVS